MRRNERISRNDHAHPVPGMKFKKCRFGNVDGGKKSDADQAGALSGIHSITSNQKVSHRHHRLLWSERLQNYEDRGSGF